MSVQYEVVFSCFLRDDTPAAILDCLRWHLGQQAERPPYLDDSQRALLRPDPASRLPGGDVASLQLQAGRSEAGDAGPVWGLFSRSLWPDDALDQLSTIMELIAPHVARQGYGGYFRDVTTADATAFEFRAADSPAAP
ncbi:MAG TPA: hypothetical protein VEL03_11775 [Streptosporangiaceae bacterium]|nr:hypothetical protein [Streptosporangiaceae bacterium]